MAPRESTYPVPSHDFLYSLEECVQATESCCETLTRGLENLELGTRDLPRLGKVLRNKHHYLVLPQPTIQSYKSSLSSTLAPQIDALISRADNLLQEESIHMNRLEERLGILQSAKLPEVSNTSSEVTGSGNRRSKADEVNRGRKGDEGDTKGGSKLEGIEMKDLNPAQRRKIIMLRGKRERLEKERERLNMR
ncbi:hypothetical protein M231_06959 [Tremella mesenterica]|uniref:DASH complex subunit SPC19 n=1 Tax=Tremella mesenterica TaxID=5217 RepID=A0A4Q1BG28_TREME|nr:hypothetical protein M231_06959 [Tremella mesenterica]